MDWPAISAAKPTTKPFLYRARYGRIGRKRVNIAIFILNVADLRVYSETAQETSY